MHYGFRQVDDTCVRDRARSRRSPPERATAELLAFGMIAVSLLSADGASSFLFKGLFGNRYDTWAFMSEDGKSSNGFLALQLRFSLEVSAARLSLVSASPE